MATGRWRPFTNYIFYFFVDEKTQGKKQRTQGKDREKTGNFVLLGAWQPCFWHRLKHSENKRFKLLGRKI